MPKLVRKKDKPQAQPLAAATGAGLERFIDNALGVPEFIARGVDYAEALPGRLIGEDNAAFLFGEGSRPVPADESVLGLPSGREVMAGVSSLPGILQGQAPSEAFGAALADRQQIEESAPFAAAVGQLGGDAASLMSGRLPIRAAGAPSAVGQSGGLLDNTIDQGLSRFSANLGAKAAGAETGIARQAKEIVDSDFFRESARGFGRAAETGLEAAVLSAVQDADPIETAGIAAGGQLAASAGLATVAGMGDAVGPSRYGPVARRVIGLSITAGIGGAVLAALQQNPVEAIENSFDKITAGLIVGAAATIGKRPKSDGLLKNFPAIADTILAVPRAGMINLAQAMAEDEPTQELVMRMKDAPDTITEKQATMIHKAIKDGNVKEVARELRTQNTQSGKVVLRRKQELQQ